MDLSGLFIAESKEVNTLKEKWLATVRGRQQKH